MRAAKGEMAFCTHHYRSPLSLRTTEGRGADGGSGDTPSGPDLPSSSPLQVAWESAYCWWLQRPSWEEKPCLHNYCWAGFQTFYCLMSVLNQREWLGSSLETNWERGMTWTSAVVPRIWGFLDQECVKKKLGNERKWPAFILPREILKQQVLILSPVIHHHHIFIKGVNLTTNKSRKNVMLEGRAILQEKGELVTLNKERERE